MMDIGTPPPAPAEPKPARWQRNDSALRDLLALVDREVPIYVIAGWSEARARLVAEWASAAHLHANDNDVRVPGEPSATWLYAPKPHRTGCGCDDCAPF